MEKCNWFETEFKYAELGDLRLKNRLIKIANSIYNLPESPINQSCETWSQAKAAYRFFKNKNVTTNLILSSHIKNTALRCREHRRVLVVQDSTPLVYRTHKKTTGLGNIAKKKGKTSKDTDSEGLIMHSSLALTAEGVPLGFLDQKIFARHSRDKSDKRAKFNIPIEEKESYRWIESVVSSEKALAEMKNTKIVTICDREADFYDLYRHCNDINSEFLIRANKNRKVNKRSRFSEATGEKLQDFLKNLKSSGSFDFKPPAGKGNKDRRLNLRFGKFQLSAHHDNYKFRFERLPNIDTTAIFVNEPNPPEGEDPIEWILFTNMKIDSFDEALEKVQWYCLRWRIEMFHKVLKSGFKIEYCRLATAERLIKYLTLVSIIALKIFIVTLLCRSDPNLRCSIILEEEEWQVLYLKTYKKSPPKQPPKISQVIKWIAKLGGFLDRNGDSHPGTTAIWRGWKRLVDLTCGYRLARLI